MKFTVGGVSVTIKGDPSLDKTKVSLKAMLHTLRSERGGVLVELNQLETPGSDGTTESSPEVPASLRTGGSGGVLGSL